MTIQHIKHSDLDTERKLVAKHSTLVSILVNVCLASFQLLLGLISHSYALVADSIHTFSDLISDFIVLIANRFSHNKPDVGHPFGHFRFETIATLLISLLLILVGVEIISHAVQLLTTVRHTTHSSLAFFVALIALCTKELLYRYLMKRAKSVRSTLLVANAWHARSDAISSCVVALGLLAQWFGVAEADLVAAMLVGAIISFVGAKMAWNALADLADRAIDPQTLEQLTQIIQGTPGLLGMHGLKTRKSGDMILIEVDLELPAQMSIEQAHKISNAMKQRVFEKRPDVLEIVTHFDPITDSACEKTITP